jgi:hypothetical protein
VELTKCIWFETNQWFLFYILGLGFHINNISLGLISINMIDLNIVVHAQPINKVKIHTRTRQ